MLPKIPNDHNLEESRFIWGFTVLEVLEVSVHVRPGQVCEAKGRGAGSREKACYQLMAAEEKEKAAAANCPRNTDPGHVPRDPSPATNSHLQQGCLVYQEVQGSF